MDNTISELTVLGVLMRVSVEIPMNSSAELPTVERNEKINVLLLRAIPRTTQYILEWGDIGAVFHFSNIGNVL